MATGIGDVELWLLWKRTAERVRADVVAEVTAAVRLPEPEVTVLVHLDRDGGVLRQNALAAATGWDRTRLSHLLTRMEAAGLVSRTRLRNGVDVGLETAGVEALAAARPVLEAVVARRFASRLSDGRRAALAEALEALADEAG